MGRTRTGTTTKKVQERVGKIFDGLQEGKTLAMIAQEEGVTERTLQYNMKRPEFQIRMDAMLTELSRTVPEWIRELHASDDPLDRRTAATLGTQMLKSKIPHESNITKVTVDIDPGTRIFGDIFDHLTPEQQAPIIEAYKNRRIPRMVDSDSKVIDIIPAAES